MSAENQQFPTVYCLLLVYFYVVYSLQSM